MYLNSRKNLWIREGISCQLVVYGLQEASIPHGPASFCRLNGEDK